MRDGLGYRLHILANDVLCGRLRLQASSHLSSQATWGNPAVITSTSTMHEYLASFHTTPQVRNKAEFAPWLLALLG